MWWQVFDYSLRRLNAIFLLNGTCIIIFSWPPWCCSKIFRVTFGFVTAGTARHTTTVNSLWGGKHPYWTLEIFFSSTAVKICPYEQFFTALDKTSAEFKYLQVYPMLSASKINAVIFVVPQVKVIIKRNNFPGIWLGHKKATLNSFVAVFRIFPWNHKFEKICVMCSVRSEVLSLPLILINLRRTWVSNQTRKARIFTMIYWTLEFTTKNCIMKIIWWVYWAMNYFEQWNRVLK